MATFAPVTYFRHSDKRLFIKRFFVAMLCGAIALFAACGRQSPPLEEREREPSILRIATSFKIQNLDPVRPAYYFLVEYGVAELPLTLDENNHINPWLLEILRAN